MKAVRSTLKSSHSGFANNLSCNFSCRKLMQNSQGTVFKKKTRNVTLTKIIWRPLQAVPVVPQIAPIWWLHACNLIEKGGTAIVADFSDFFLQTLSGIFYLIILPTRIGKIQQDQPQNLQDDSAAWTHALRKIESTKKCPSEVGTRQNRPSMSQNVKRHSCNGPAAKIEVTLCRAYLFPCAPRLVPN